ncbi:hypothetical protein E2C01_017832 [Portunus trituberculatus]|uniref:Uncharacterized protein n=1 Tax=Portunus trituberculatus TaxID=210409 RepID=A0A5B7DTI6_PORTR|nr:hypothetical protein [Portunus trituberculatus]
MLLISFYLFVVGKVTLECFCCFQVNIKGERNLYIYIYN